MRADAQRTVRSALCYCALDNDCDSPSYFGITFARTSSKMLPSTKLGGMLPETSASALCMENGATNVFGETYQDNNGLLTTTDRSVETLLDATQAFPSNPRIFKSEISTKPFYKAALRYPIDCAALFSKFARLTPIHSRKVASRVSWRQPCASPNYDNDPQSFVLFCKPSVRGERWNPQNCVSKPNAWTEK